MFLTHTIHAGSLCETLEYFPIWITFVHSGLYITQDINKRWRDQFTTCVSIHVYINPEECFGHLGALIQFCFNNETDLWSCKPDLLFVFG